MKRVLLIGIAGAKLLPAPCVWWEIQDGDLICVSYGQLMLQWLSAFAASWPF